MATNNKLFATEKYSEKAFHFPRHDVDTAIKRDNPRGNFWYEQYFQAMYSDFLNDRSAIPYSKRDEMDLLRLYGQGNQPVTKYMDILCPLEPGETERKGLMNISYDIISVAPKFRRIFIGQFEKQEHDIIASAINDKALAEKEDQKWMLWANAKMQPYMDMMAQKMGIESQTPEFLPETLSELEMYMNDGFKLPTEMAIEMGVDFAFYLSDWPEVKKKVIGDFFDLGVGFTQDYVDKIDRKVKARYLDPKRVICRYTDDPMFANVDHWGYIDEITIAALRQEAPELTEEEIYEIARGYCNFGLNSSYYSFNNLQSGYRYQPDANGMYPYDNYVVNILRGEWISSDTEVTSTRSLPDGSSKTFKEGYHYSKSDTDKRKVSRARYQMTYKGVWVIGTKYMYDCGLQYDVPRPEKKRPKLSLNGYKYADKSILASIIPNLDSFQLAWLKLQNAKAMAAPAGLAVEISALENISIDGNKMGPLQILTIRRETGDYLYKLTTHHSEANNVNSSSAIKEIEGGIGAQLQEFIACMEYDINMIRQQTGMNELVDASTPNPDQPVRTSQIAVQSANNALQPIYSGYTFIKESVAKKFALRYQIMAINGEIKGYLPSLGSNVVQLFIITKDVAYEDYAIKLRLRPTDEMKMAVRKDIDRAVQLGPLNGGISGSDALYIEDVLQNGNLKKARLFLAYKERQYAKLNEKMQKQNMELNGQNMQAQEQAKMQSAQAITQQEFDNKMKELQVTFDNKLRELDAQNTHKLQQIEAQNQGKAGITALQGIITHDQKSLDQVDKTKN